MSACRLALAKRHAESGGTAQDFATDGTGANYAECEIRQMLMGAIHLGNRAGSAVQAPIDASVGERPR